MPSAPTTAAILLLLTLLALAAGPLLHRMLAGRARALAWLDGFVLTAVSLLIVFEVVPEVLAAAGPVALLWIALGALGPTLLERAVERVRREAHLLTLLLAVFGLALHSVADGVTLAGIATSGHAALGYAVALHTVPLGIAVWWLMAPSLGRRWPSLALLAMAAATVAGYLGGARFGALFGDGVWAALQAVVAGSLLHVVVGRPHFEPAVSPAGRTLQHWDGVGALIAIALLLAPLLPGLPAPHGDHRHETLLEPFLHLAQSAAAAMLLALVAALALPRSGPSERWPRLALRVAPLALLTLAFAGWPLGAAVALAGIAGLALRAPLRRTSEPEPALPTGLAAAAAFGERTLPWLFAGLVAATVLQATGLASAFATLPASVQIVALGASASLLHFGGLGFAPLAGVLLAAGVSGAAVLAGLLAAGWGALGTATALRIGLSLAVGGVATLLPWTPGRLPPAEDWPLLLRGAGVLLLGALAVATLLRRGARGFALTSAHGPHEHGHGHTHDRPPALPDGHPSTPPRH